MSLPITEVKEVVALLVSGINTGRKIAQDGKVNVDDIPAVFEFFKKVPPALEGIGKVPAELEDLDEAEAAELVAFTMSELAFDNEEKAKNIVEASLKLSAAAYSLFLAVKG